MDSEGPLARPPHRTFRFDGAERSSADAKRSPPSFGYPLPWFRSTQLPPPSRCGRLERGTDPRRGETGPRSSADSDRPSGNDASLAVVVGLEDDVRLGHVDDADQPGEGTESGHGWKKDCGATERSPNITSDEPILTGKMDLAEQIGEKRRAHLRSRAVPSTGHWSCPQTHTTSRQSPAA